MYVGGTEEPGMHGSTDVACFNATRAHTPYFVCTTILVDLPWQRRPPRALHRMQFVVCAPTPRDDTHFTTCISSSKREYGSSRVNIIVRRERPPFLHRFEVRRLLQQFMLVLLGLRLLGIIPFRQVLAQLLDTLLQPARV